MAQSVLGRTEADCSEQKFVGKLPPDKKHPTMLPTPQEQSPETLLQDDTSYGRPTAKVKTMRATKVKR